MTTKTKRLPDGMNELLERIGADTNTARLCESGDYAGALAYLRGTIRPTEWTTQARVGDVQAIGPNQEKTNRPRAEAYASLATILEGLVDG